MSVGEIISATYVCCTLWFATYKSIKKVKESYQKQRMWVRGICAIISTIMFLLSAANRENTFSVIFYCVIVVSAIIISIQEYLLSRK